MAREGGNPNIAEIGKQPSPAKTPEGKFMRNLSHFKRENIPFELLNLYDFYKRLDTKKIDYLVELKNVYLVIQQAMLPTLVDKLTHGEMLNRKELDALRLIKDTLVESHKLKFGDKQVIENIVSVADIRKHMMKGKKIVEAEVKPVEPIPQDLDRSRRGEGDRSPRKDNEDNEDNQSPPGC